MNHRRYNRSSRRPRRTSPVRLMVVVVVSIVTTLLLVSSLSNVLVAAARETSSGGKTGGAFDAAYCSDNNNNDSEGGGGGQHCNNNNNNDKENNNATRRSTSEESPPVVVDDVGISENKNEEESSSSSSSSSSLSQQQQQQQHPSSYQSSSSSSEMMIDSPYSSSELRRTTKNRNNDDEDDGDNNNDTNQDSANDTTDGGNSGATTSSSTTTTNTNSNDYSSYNDNDQQEEEEQCRDEYEQCVQWSTEGECDINRYWMVRHCRWSCHVCYDRYPTVYETVPDVGDEGISFGERQLLTSLLARKSLQQTREYMNQRQLLALTAAATTTTSTTTSTSSSSTLLSPHCRNTDERCSYWAAYGECQKNAPQSQWMERHCGPSCQSCGHTFDYELRCGPIDRTTNIYRKPGELNGLFERIVDPETNDEDVKQYQPFVHSRPKRKMKTTTGGGGGGGSTTMMENNSSNRTQQPEEEVEDEEEDQPWIITFENFLTPYEARHLIQLGRINGYERSTTGTGITNKVDGTEYQTNDDPGRTSQTTWCRRNTTCHDNPIHLSIIQRISNVLRIPSYHFEDTQLLHYSGGTFYREHHDYGEGTDLKTCGPRILTFFLYLNDVDVDYVINDDPTNENGGTRFNQVMTSSTKTTNNNNNNTGSSTSHPRRPITVQPRVGRAVLWPSVLDSDPSAMDVRTRHEALTVPLGREKYGANVWVRLRDFETANERNCCS